jgi:serine/threonine protein kinase
LNEGYFERFFVKESRLGSGAYGAVHKVRHCIDDIDLGTYAVKIVAAANSTWLPRILTEVKALERLKRHPNIIGYRHSWLQSAQVADFGPVVPALFILMDLANAGNVEDSAVAGLDEPTVWDYFLDIINGIDHLHRQCSIIHRDLKPRNLLLHRERDPRTKQEKTRVLISDFGTAVMLNTPGSLAQHNRTGATGTLEWLAPELVADGTPIGSTMTYNAKSDMWSVGLILFFMAYGRLPWSGSDADSLFKSILSHRRIVCPPGRSKALEFFIDWLLQPDPRHRPSAHDLLAHPTIVSMRKAHSGKHSLAVSTEVITPSEFVEEIDSPISKPQHRPRSTSFNKIPALPPPESPHRAEKREHILRKTLTVVLRHPGTTGFLVFCVKVRIAVKLMQQQHSLTVSNRFSRWRFSAVIHIRCSLFSTSLPSEHPCTSLSRFVGSQHPLQQAACFW